VQQQRARKHVETHPFGQGVHLPTRRQRHAHAVAALAEESVKELPSRFSSRQLALSPTRVKITSRVLDTLATLAGATARQQPGFQAVSGAHRWLRWRRASTRDGASQINDTVSSLQIMYALGRLALTVCPHHWRAFACSIFESPEGQTGCVRDDVTIVIEAVILRLTPASGRAAYIYYVMGRCWPWRWHTLKIFACRPCAVEVGSAPSAATEPPHGDRRAAARWTAHFGVVLGSCWHSTVPELRCDDLRAAGCIRG
jgi:hypothetical protein